MTNQNSEAAAALAAAGWKVFPLRENSKLPAIKAWPALATNDAATVAEWWTATPRAGIGIATGHHGVFVLDLDTANGKQGAESLAALVAEHGPLPDTLTARTASGGTHLYFTALHPVRNSASKVGIDLDIRGTGGYVVACPTVIGQSAYKWERMAPIAAAPAWLLLLATAAAPTSSACDALAPVVDVTPELVADLQSALDQLPADNRGDWISIGAALRSLGDVGRDLWIAWSATSDSHDAQNDPEVWDTIGHESTGYAAIFAKAAALGWMNPRSTSAVDLTTAGFGESATSTPGAFDPCSHVANAHRIVKHYGDQLLYVDGIGWHVWAAPWKSSNLAAKKIVQGLGKVIAAEAAALGTWVAQADGYIQRDDREKVLKARFKWASSSESESNIESSLRLAAPMLHCDAAELDANPDLLGLPHGTLELLTGTMREHRQADRITKVAGCNFDGLATAPTWERFIAETLGGDVELIDYLQRLAGYALWGNRQDHILPILYGSGANGKSTFIGALQSVLGQYSGAAASGLLIQRSNEQHASSTAGLQGMRLVIVSETGEFGRLNEEQVKALTGGDRISARRLYQEAFEFQPTHLLMLQTNHKPTVAGNDEGIWRRLRLIPFTVTVPDDRRDAELPTKLRAEMPGILAWCWRGLQRYRLDGFKRTPAGVVAATAEYRRASDQIASWLADCCVEDLRSAATAADLYASYTTWCAQNGERARSQRDMGLRLAERGFEQSRNATARLWQGLRLVLPGDRALRIVAASLIG